MVLAPATVKRKEMTAAQRREIVKKRRAAGLCVDCAQPSEGKRRCTRHQKEKGRKGLHEWYTVKKAFSDHLSAEKCDRRMGSGGHGKALDWALVNWRMRHTV